MSAQTTVSTDTIVRPELTVRSITINDLRTIFYRGRDDFFARPTYGVFLTFFYLLVAVFTAVAGLGENLLPLLFPLISGVALLGPLAACGLYVLSRRREAGQNYSLWHVFDVFTAPSRWAIAAMAVILAVLFVAWMMTALAGSQRADYSCRMAIDRQRLRDRFCIQRGGVCCDSGWFAIAD